MGCLGRAEILRWRQAFLSCPERSDAAPATLWQAERAVDRLWEEEVHELARIHYAARRLEAVFRHEKSLAVHVQHQFSFCRHRLLWVVTSEGSRLVSPRMLSRWRLRAG